MGMLRNPWVSRHGGCETLRISTVVMRDASRSSLCGELVLGLLRRFNGTGCGRWAGTPEGSCGRRRDRLGR